MDRNFVLACALSLAVLVGWMYLTGDPDRERKSGGNPPIHAQPLDSIENPSQETRASATATPLEKPSDLALAALAPQSDQIGVEERQLIVEMPLYSVA